MSRLFLLTIIYFITATFAHAQQRPLFTDDVDITSPGSIELSVGVDFLQNAKFPLSGLKGDLTKVGDIRLRTGLANNVEIQIEGTVQNFLAINSQSASNVPLRITGNSTNDFDDFTFSTKIKLANEGRFRPAIGFKFGFQMPNTDQSRGIGTNQINIFGKMILQKSFGKRFTGGRRASIYGNLGLAIMSAPLQNFTQNDLLLYGLAGNFRLNKRISIVSEINGRLNTRSG
ncbi:MAG TPA: hypothetical protein VNK26_08230, partial [Pyrinomonadaceae bacterium]|nr:hypothetical protein [Pyrinomonadaceae bacterium]